MIMMQRARVSGPERWPETLRYHTLETTKRREGVRMRGTPGLLITILVVVVLIVLLTRLL
jgi:hypothetical protein